MDEAIRKAGVLIEALGWIRQFRGKTIVIKLGGSVMDDADSVRKFLTDVIFLSTVGCHPVIIHGGGKAINRALRKEGIESRFVRGRRYTDPDTLQVASKVLTEEVCGFLVNAVGDQRAEARELSFRTEPVLFGSRLTLPPDDGAGSPIDLGAVGEVTRIDPKPILEICKSGGIPILPCIAIDEANESERQLLNVNADTAAAAVARLLKAEKLLFLSDVPGIYRDIDEPSSLISHLDTRGCRELIASGVIASGMVPKVEAALDALDAGVGKIHIVDARMPHSVLLEIFSNRGVGTEIVPHDLAATAL